MKNLKKLIGVMVMKQHLIQWIKPLRLVRPCNVNCFIDEKTVVMVKQGGRWVNADTIAEIVLADSGPVWMKNLKRHLIQWIKY